MNSEFYAKIFATEIFATIRLWFFAGRSGRAERRCALVNNNEGKPAGFLSLCSGCKAARYPDGRGIHGGRASFSLIMLNTAKFVV